MTLLILYLLLLIEATLFGLALTAAAIWAAPRLGFVDRPGQRKIHATPKPVLGGVAVYLAFASALGLNLAIAARFAGSESFLNQTFPVPLANIALVSKELKVIIAGSFAMLILGVADDRRPLPPGLKLLVQILAALPLLWAGVVIQGFMHPPLGAVVTVLWVVFITNAFNFMDNMDGLCGGVAAIALGVFAIISYQGQEWFMTAIFLALAGALVGFLLFNWHPSRIFLGDGGALSVGYLIASLSILCTYYRKEDPTALPILMPLLVLGVPIFDSLSVYAIRLKERRPLWVGDTRHFSHRLVALGMSRKQAVLFIYLVTLVVALGALPLRQLDWREGLLHTAQMLLIFAIIAFLEAVGSSDPNRNRPTV